MFKIFFKTHIAVFFPVSLTDGTICNLTSYPGAEGRGPLFLQYFDDQEILVACGSWALGERHCFRLSSGASEAWEEIPSLINGHCSYPTNTRSHYLSSLGWFVIGQDDSCSTDKSVIVTELLTPDNEWIQTDTENPYEGAGFPCCTCNLPINGTHLMVTGGFNGETLAATWILDLTDNSWSPAAPMLTTRSSHGCMLTGDGEVLVAGGFDGSQDLGSVHVYNIEANAWRPEDDLPEEMYKSYPVLFSWNNMPLLIESDSTRIWQRTGSEWEAMEASVGEVSFYGYHDMTALVPEGMFQCL